MLVPLVHAVSTISNSVCVYLSVRKTKPPRGHRASPQAPGLSDNHGSQSQEDSRGLISAAAPVPKARPGAGHLLTLETLHTMKKHVLTQVLPAF